MKSSLQSKHLSLAWSCFVRKKCKKKKRKGSISTIRNVNTVSNLVHFLFLPLFYFLHATLPPISLHLLHGAPPPPPPPLLAPFLFSFSSLSYTTTPLALHALLAGALPNQDHSGTLGPEEFKACLISLGYDIGNDAQVLNASKELRQISNPKGITYFSLLFFFVLIRLSMFLYFIVHISAYCYMFCHNSILFFMHCQINFSLLGYTFHLLDSLKLFLPSFLFSIFKKIIFLSVPFSSCC